MYSCFTGRIWYHINTLYLFTVDDFLSILVPNAVCGVLLPLADGFWQEHLTMHCALWRMPLMISWIWINLLLFDLSNQSQPGSIEEDLENKPWRPVASGRLSSQDIPNWENLARFTAFYISLNAGGMGSFLLLQILTFLYNGLNGGEYWLSRNLLNAGGYLSFMIGAMQVTTNTQTLRLTCQGLKWLIWTFLLIACSVQAQDIYDQEGDTARNRKTIPLIYGDKFARYSVALSVGTGSLLAPFYWQCSVLSLSPIWVLGMVIIARLFANREKSQQYDKHTFVLWNAWMTTAHILPLYT